MDSNVSISILDVIGQVKEGLALLLTIVIEEKSYEMIYWINKENKYGLEVDQNMLKDFKIDNIYEYSNINKLILFIEKNIPDKNKLFDEYNI